MTPEQEARYRRTTHSGPVYGWQTRHCKVCRKPRSLGQYEGKSKVCNQCRGVK